MWPEKVYLRLLTHGFWNHLRPFVKQINNFQRLWGHVPTYDPAYTRPIRASILSLILHPEKPMLDPQIWTPHNFVLHVFSNKSQEIKTEKIAICLLSFVFLERKKIDWGKLSFHRPHDLLLPQAYFYNKNAPFHYFLSSLKKHWLPSKITLKEEQSSNILAWTIVEMISRWWLSWPPFWMNSEVPSRGRTQNILQKRHLLSINS